MTITRRLALQVAAVALGLGLVMGIAFPPGAPEFLPRCLTAPLVGLETPKNAAEFLNIWRSKGLDQGKVTDGLYWDFLLMAGYGSVLVMWGLLIRQRRLRAPDGVIGLAVVALAVVAVGADVGENLNLLGMIKGPATDGGADLTRQFSYTKWATLGGTLLLAHRAFLPTRRGSLLYAFVAWAGTLACFTGGVLGILGLWDTPKFELVVLFMSVAFLVQVPLFAAYWEKHMWSPNQPVKAEKDPPMTKAARV